MTNKKFTIQTTIFTSTESGNDIKFLRNRHLFAKNKIDLADKYQKHLDKLSKKIGGVAIFINHCGDKKFDLRRLGNLIQFIIL